MASLGRHPDDTRLPYQPAGDPVHGALALLAINLALGIASLGAQFAELYWLLFPGLILWARCGSAMVLIALRQRAAERCAKVRADDRSKRARWRRDLPLRR